MKVHDSLPALLQDIRWILCGIAWLILGGFLCLGALFLILTDHSAFALLPLLPGILLCVAGSLYVWHGGQALREKTESPNE